MVNKKGQGLSLNVIIVAAIALIVLVVLIAIFAGRAGAFDKKVSDQASQELTVMKTFYGSCHPTGVSEAAFKLAYGKALIEDDQEEKIIAQEGAKAEFQEKITSCRNAGSSADICGETDGCAWG